MIRWLKLALTFFMRNYATGHVVSAFKRRGLRTYFRAVNGVRRVLVTLVLLAVVLNVMTTSFFGMIATAGWLFIEDERLRLYVLLGTFSLTFLIPLVGGWYLLSEKFWLRLSGAESLVEDGSRS